MINTLYLPELREMLASSDERELREFCTALHPARTAEFMEGLDADEAWRVLQYAEPNLQAKIYQYFELDRKLELLKNEDEVQVAALVTNLPADDVVDLFQELDSQRVDQILALVPAPDRRDIRRLQTFPEGTAGALMTTEAACLTENLTVQQAMEQLSKQAARLETIYYIYVIDSTNHLRGIVSARSLVSSIGRPNTRLVDLMKTDIVTVNVHDDQEQVAERVAFYNLSAIPVVDDQLHLVGIITHDDIIDVVRREATEDVQRMAGVEPLPDSYMRTAFLTLSWKRGIWLTILFFAALLAAFALQYFHGELTRFDWLVWFLPLIISSGGNSGSQSSTLIISALATRDVATKDAWHILKREFFMGILLGSVLGIIGFGSAIFLAPSPYAALVIPITILVVVVCGTSLGSMLPLLLKNLGLDPALMSSPLIAGISDILGIVIYLNVAVMLLG
ncbi:MAG: magnesium transporter [Pirellulaceae bacterium]|nr:magnesium transporter [Pirellulaceae bacterium]